jgi:hypothetical protein
MLMQHDAESVILTTHYIDQQRDDVSSMRAPEEGEQFNSPSARSATEKEQPKFGPHLAK